MNVQRGKRKLTVAMVAKPGVRGRRPTSIHTGKHTKKVILYDIMILLINEQIIPPDTNRLWGCHVPRWH